MGDDLQIAGSYDLPLEHFVSTVIDGKVSQIRVSREYDASSNNIYKDADGNPVGQKNLIAATGLSQYIINKAFKDNDNCYVKANRKIAQLLQKKERAENDKRIGDYSKHRVIKKSLAKYTLPCGKACAAGDVMEYYSASYFSVYNMFKKYDTVTAHERLKKAMERRNENN
jgi:hypothetical protein